MVVAACIVTFGSGDLYAASVGTLTSFTNGTVADANEVNANFAAITTAVDDNDSRISAANTAIGDADGRLSDLEGAIDVDGGNVGIGGPATAATLRVEGDLEVAWDYGMLPWANCDVIELSDPAAGDLADQISPHLADQKCLTVQLVPGTTWTWNNPLTLTAFQRLNIIGQGHSNGAANLTVTIQMTANADGPGPSGNNADYKNPHRLFADAHAWFDLTGVEIDADFVDSRPITSTGYCGGAMFCGGVRSVLRLTQMRGVTNEHLVGVGAWSDASVVFGHTYIDKGSTSDTVYAVNKYTGWSFASGFARVLNSHTTIGGLEYASDDTITYAFPPAPPAP
jgi:hypothetical protein